MKNTILKQILIPVLAILVLLTVLIIGTVVRLFSSSYRTEIDERNENTASYIADEIQTFMSGAYNLTDDFWRNPYIMNWNGDEQKIVLEDVVRRNPYIELAYTVNMDGMQTARSSGNCGDRKNRWWFIKMMELRKPFVSKSYYSVSTNRPCASIFIPIVPDGEMTGMACVDLMLDKLLQIVDKYTDAENGRYSFVIDGEGAVVAHPDRHFIEELYNYRTMSRTVGMKNADGSMKTDSDGNIQTKDETFEVDGRFASAVTAVLSGRSGLDEAEIDGADSFIAYSPVSLEGSSDGWGVITVQHKDKAFSLRNRILSYTLLIGGLAGLKWVRLNGNRLSDLPASAANWKDVRRLYLRGNAFESVPESVCALPALQQLDLGRNQRLATLPDAIGNLASLTRLDLDYTAVTRLPDALGKLRGLRTLVLYGSPVPPEEVERIRPLLPPDCRIEF